MRRFFRTLVPLRRYLTVEDCPSKGNVARLLDALTVNLFYLTQELFGRDQVFSRVRRANI